MNAFPFKMENENVNLEYIPIEKMRKVIYWKLIGAKTQFLEFNYARLRGDALGHFRDILQRKRVSSKK